MANSKSLESSMIKSITDYMEVYARELQADSDAKNFDNSDLDYDAQAEMIGFMIGEEIAEVLNAISHTLDGTKSARKSYSFDGWNFRDAVKKYLDK